jgi:hypothetical protein
VILFWLLDPPHMAVQAFRNPVPRGGLVGLAAPVVIGVALIAVAPAKQPVERASTVAA